MTAVRGPLGVTVRPPRCVRGLGLILRPRRRLSGLADIPDFTESDSTGLDWFVCGLGPCFAADITARTSLTSESLIPLASIGGMHWVH